MGEVAAVVLAAGEASRFGSPKQRLLLPSVLERLRESLSTRSSSSRAPTTSSADEDVRIVPLPRLAARSRARRFAVASKRSARTWTSRSSSSPTVPTSRRRRSSACSASGGSTGGVVTASYGGGRGHPLVLGREDWSGIPDEGLRDRPVRLVPCDDLGAPGDVDRPEDLSGL